MDVKSARPFASHKSRLASEDMLQVGISINLPVTVKHLRRHPSPFFLCFFFFPFFCCFSSSSLVPKTLPPEEALLCRRCHDEAHAGALRTSPEVLLDLDTNELQHTSPSPQRPSPPHQNRSKSIAKIWARRQLVLRAFGPPQSAPNCVRIAASDQRKTRASALPFQTRQTRKKEAGETRQKKN